MLNSGLWFPVVGAGYIDTFWRSSFSGRSIVVVLGTASVVLWWVAVIKWREIATARNNSQQFLAKFRQAPHPAALYVWDDEAPPAFSPLQVIYNHACAALGASLEANAQNPGELFVGANPAIKPGAVQVAAAKSAADRMVSDQALLLEKNMGWLAIGATAAPFLGLLGTVIGVMEAFGNMGSTGAALLSDVAPGISAALLTTVVGLMVALPASIFYNVLGDRIRQLTVMMDTFSQELGSDFERMSIS